MSVVREAPVLRFIRKLAVREQCAGLPDSTLLDRFASSGDEEAFATLVRRHGPIVWRVCLQSLGDEHDAEDAFQATFLVLSRKASSVKKQQSVGSWLFGVANHAATDLKRKYARRRSHESQAGQATASDLLTALTLREAQAILNEELCRLPEKVRAPLVLCSLEGLTRDEAAKQLGVRLGTLKSRLEQARKQLRSRLISRGLTVSATFVASVLSEQMASAAIPAGLLTFITQAATSIAAGRAVTSVVSGKVAALTDGVLRTMLMSKLKIAAAFLLSVVFIGTTGGIFTRQVLEAAAQDSENQQPPVVLEPERAPQEPPGSASQAKKNDQQMEKISYRLGELLQPRFFLKNVGNEPIEVSYPRLITQSYYKALRVTDNEGHKIPIHQIHEVGVPVGWVGVRLLAGEYAETTGLFLSIGNELVKGSAETLLHVSPGQTCRVQFTVPDYGDSKAGDLKTGEFSYRVLEKDATEPKQPTADELKKHIAWGKPGKDGLQIGVLLVPFKENPIKNSDAKEKGAEPANFEQEPEITQGPKENPPKRKEKPQTLIPVFKKTSGGWHFAATYRNTSADEVDLPTLLKESSVVLDGKEHARQGVKFGGRSNLHPDESWTFTIEMTNYLGQDETLSEGRHTLTLKFGGQEFGPVEFVWAVAGKSRGLQERH
jgi:RNA polymerase sigma factor (sigma-70 family)